MPPKPPAARRAVVLPKFKLAYCTTCAPPVVVAAGPFEGVFEHRAKNGDVHSSLKVLEVDEKWERGEQPQALLNRLQKKYKDKLK